MNGKKRTMRKRRAQSRTRKLSRGGAVAVLPNVERIATAVQPRVGTRKKTRLEMFNDEYDVFFIAAHGTLLQDSNYVVPPDTYISNLSASGCELVHNEELERVFYSISSGNNESSANTYSYDTDFWNYLTTPKYNTKIKPNNNSSKPTTSIYEPGDSVPDNSLSFLNTIFFGGIGIFKVPIPEYVLTTKKRLAKKFIDALDTLHSRKQLRVTPQGLPVFTKEFQYFLDDLSVEFIRTTGNLFHPILKRQGPEVVNPFECTLSKLLKEPELQPAPGKKRLIILQTCRGLSVKPNRITLSRIRRSSLNRRKYTMPPSAGAAAAGQEADSEERGAAAGQEAAPEAAGGKAKS